MPGPWPSGSIRARWDARTGQTFHRHARARCGHPRLVRRKLSDVVDGRDKPSHDGEAPRTAPRSGRLAMSKPAPTSHRLVSIKIDESSIGRGGPDVEHE